MRGLSRWFWAFLIGGVLGMFPAVWYWIRCGKVDLLDWIVLVDLILPGVAYGQMALVASLLFDDPLGANPITVGQALWRVGLRSLRSAPGRECRADARGGVVGSARGDQDSDPGTLHALGVLDLHSVRGAGRDEDPGSRIPSPGSQDRLVPR